MKGKALNINLTDNQAKAYNHLTDDVTRVIYYGGAGGGGKGWLGCTWIWTQMLSFNEVRYFLGRKELKRLRESTLRTFWKVVSHYGGTKMREDLRFNENRGIITHKHTGSELFLIELADKPSDPDFDDLGSLEFTGGFVDEAPEISFGAYEAIRTRVGRQNNDIYSLKPKVLLAGNPAKNWVYHEFYKPYREGVLSKDKAFVQALAGDNPYLPEEYIEALQSLPEDSPRKQRILYGNWEYDDDPTTLMGYDEINDIFHNEGLKRGRRYITADIARQGRDKTVIGVWSGWRLEGITVIKRNKLDQAVEVIEDLRKKYRISKKNVIVDAEGVGGGVVDFGGYRGFVSSHKPLPERGKKMNFANLKSQCYFKLADRVNEGKLYVAESHPKHMDRIIEELSVVRRDDPDNDQKVKVTSKEKMKQMLNGRSPDYADMLMLRAFFDLKIKKFLV